jgi:prepilin-type N-terminal cleavage/methylation domain-containing protein
LYNFNERLRLMMCLRHYRNNLRHHCDAGFSLVELAIVLVIVALLLGGLMVSIGAQQEIQSRNTTERRIADAIEALTGYIVANGRLPCPASDGTTGVANPDTGGICNNPYDGFLPAVTLGIGPTDANGYMLDAWGNRIRYAVTTSNASAFTTAGQIRTLWSGGTLAPDLQVCSTSAGSTTSACATDKDLTKTALAIVFSRGTNGGITPSSDDEKANAVDGGTPNKVFVSHTPTQMGTSNEFDDMLVWLSPNILYNRMIAAGRLP